ncbi:F-box protein At3g07870-like [Papaver somniferum]|uniref:F-box protein At3g07870-like n=1 Tax=Papaver somniferum TaxID=3469 RepID=UPI000E6FC60A|nr:F-box protein At3g07870-like [Papaver somniferum]
MRLEILTRVPTQTVLDCKLVSKSWRQIVRHPSFSRKHLKHLNDSDSGKLMGFILFHKTPGLEEYAEYDDESSSSHGTPPFSKARRFNIISPFEHYDLLDSCNGLICFNALRSGYPFAAFLPLADRLVYYGPSFICNPVTRECVVLPKFEGEDLLTGFGYCSSTNEYKVVGIRCCKREAHYGVVQVYTLGSGKGWRNVGKMDYKMTDDVRKNVRSGVLANGALHWVDVGGTVLTFDLANEKLSVIPSPPIYRAAHGREKKIHKEWNLLKGKKLSQEMQTAACSDNSQYEVRDLKVKQNTSDLLTLGSMTRLLL